MAKSYKIGLVVIGALVVIIVAGLLGLQVFFPRERLRAEIVRRLEQQLQQPVSVGSVGVRVFPTPSLSLRDLEIGAAQAQTKPHITLASLDLRMRLWPLLRRKAEIIAIDIERPLVQVTMAPPATPEAARVEALGLPPAGRAAGEMPAQAAPGAAAPGQGQNISPSAGGARGGLPIEIQIERLDVHDGGVSIRRENGAPVLDLLAITQRLEAHAMPSGDIDLRGETAIDTIYAHLGAASLGRDLKIKIRESLRYARSADRLQIDEATIMLGALPVAVTGTIDGIQAKTYTADLHLLGGPARIEDIRAFIPVALVPQSAGVKSEGMLAVDARIHGPLRAEQQPAATGLDFAVLVNLSDGRLRHPQLPDEIRGINLQVRANPDSIEIERFAAQAGDSRVQLTGVAIDYATRPRVDLRLDAEVALALVSRLQNRKDFPDLSGRAAVRLHVQGPTADPLALREDGDLTLTNVAANGGRLPLAIHDVNARLRLDGHNIVIQELAAVAGTNDLHLGGSLQDLTALLPKAPAGSVAVVDLHLVSNRIDLGEQVPVFAGPSVIGRVSGRIEANVRELQFRQITARDLQAALVLDRGNVQIEKLDLSAFGGTLALSGNFDLRNPERPVFNVAVDAERVEAPQLLAYAGSFNRLSSLKDHLSGNVSFTTNMSGDLDQKLALDVPGLTATGNLAARGVLLSGYPLQDAMATFLETPDLRQLSINDWEQPYRIANGRLNIDGMSIKAGDVTITGNGWQSLDGQLQISVDVLLPPRYSTRVREMLPAEIAPMLFGEGQAQLPIPLRFSGQISSPKVSLDTDAIAARARTAAQARLNEARQGIEGALRQRAEEALGRASGAAADSSADTTRPDLKREAERLLRDLFRKK